MTEIWLRKYLCILERLFAAYVAHCNCVGRADVRFTCGQFVDFERQISKKRLRDPLRRFKKRFHTLPRSKESTSRHPCSFYVCDFLHVFLNTQRYTRNGGCFFHCLIDKMDPLLLFSFFKRLNWSEYWTRYTASQLTLHIRTDPSYFWNFSLLKGAQKSLSLFWGLISLEILIFPKNNDLDRPEFVFEPY